MGFTRIADVGGRRGGARIAACLALLLLTLVAAQPAGAAEKVYWTNSTGGADSLRVANADGSGAASTLFSGTPSPDAIALDPAAGKIYFSDAGGINVANLDGSGTPTQLFAFGTRAFGLGVDPAAGKIYWTNFTGLQVRVGNLDGSGSPQTLYTEPGGSDPANLVIDPSVGKLYWSDSDADTIRVGNLNGSGTAQTVFTDPASQPFGVAVDRAAGRIYWSTSDTHSIRFGNLDGSGSPSTLANEGISANLTGFAIDPQGGKAYWTDDGSVDLIRVGNLNGSGSPSTLFTEPAGSFPQFLQLLGPPVSTGPPVASGSGSGDGASLTLGALSCSQGTWEPGPLAAGIYRAPRSFAHQWQKDGSDISGATGSSYTPTAEGSYTCKVTATNAAGSASQTSAAVNVSAAAASAPKSSKCNRLGKKLKRWQARKLALAATSTKRAYVRANIKDTKRRLKKLGC